MHEGAFAVALGHGFGNARCLDAVTAAGEAVVSAGTELAHHALDVDGQDIRIAVDQPLRRCGGRRAQNDLKAGIAEHLDRLVEPFPMELARPGLDLRPGEFTDAHPGKPELDHAARILSPLRARPLLRIVADAEFQHVGLLLFGVEAV
ncbi:hypothetical protein D9M72_526590 [compost metagenome]